VSQPTSTKYDVLRQPVYKPHEITYDAGQVKVLHQRRPDSHGHVPHLFPGYFGITASTGGFTDRHSIRDFTLYTNKPIVSPPNAAPTGPYAAATKWNWGRPLPPTIPYRIPGTRPMA
jgi:hypothetical protein